MAEYIERQEALREVCNGCNIEFDDQPCEPDDCYIRKKLMEVTSADVAKVRHGRWILEAHDERVNYRWNVTAECSECCDEQKEIWAGFFPNVPPSIARDAALVSAESVKLSNYCPNCGAKMDGGAD